jgi:ATP synthase F1 delta subunit
MATSMNKDANEFVDGVVSYLKKDRHSKTALPRVQAFLGKVTAAAKKQKVAHVESALILTEAEKDAIERALIRHLGHEVQLECVVSPNLLGGLKIQIGDWVVDTSLKSQLDQMATILIQ